YFVSAPNDVVPRVVALAPDGKHVAGKKVRLELVNRRWTLAREQLQGGGEHAVTKIVDRVASSCELTTDVAPRTCALRADQAGYYVVVARAKDARGNAAEA